MYLGFSKRLKKMSAFRIGAGVRLSGWTAIFIILGYILFYMVYWSMLACLWCLYGCCLIIYLPIKALIRLIKGKFVAQNGTIY